MALEKHELAAIVERAKCAAALLALPLPWSDAVWVQVGETLFASAADVGVLVAEVVALSDPFRVIKERYGFEVRKGDETELGRLRAENERLANEVCDLHEVIATWKTATGLTMGGCPADVEPSDLEAFLAKVDGVVQAAKAVMPGVEDMAKRYPTHGWLWLRDRLQGALAALPPEDM